MGTMETMTEQQEQEILFANAANMAEQLNLTRAEHFTEIANLPEGTLVVLASIVSIRMGRLTARKNESVEYLCESLYLDSEEVFQLAHPLGIEGEEFDETSFLLHPSTILYR